MTPREQHLFDESLHRIQAQRDRVFFWLMLVQWACGIAIALTLSPRTWAGGESRTHVQAAIILGAALSLPSMLLTRLRPGWVGTRYVVAVTQMGWSALLIHLTGGRIETHFHIFGSLAFIAFYRDVRVLFVATLTVAADHLVRSVTWPESVFSIVNPEWWRFLEHTFWVVFEDIVLVLGIITNRNEMRVAARAQASIESAASTIEARVTERTLELERSREEYRNLIETTRALSWRYDRLEKRFTSVGSQTETLGHPTEAWLAPSFLATHAHADDLAALKQLGERAPASSDFEFRLRRADGTWAWLRCIVADQAEARVLHGLLLDVTEQRQMLLELNQAQKLESVGRLASGIAHEINTPIQFVNDSIHFISDAFTGLLPLLAANKAVVEAAGECGVSPSLLKEASEAEAAADLEYLLDNVPKALERSVDGLERVATLVRSMKEFGHPTEAKKAPADLNHALKSTLIIARNEYKYVAEVETSFEALPSIECHIGELNQAFLNIIVNAAHAIGDRVQGTENRGVIRISTKLVGAFVEVRIADTGGGIPEAVRDRIFEPFFTTKGVGKGTGQGLSIARNVVVEKHQGSLTFETTSGVGTTFILRLPCVAASAAQEAA